MNGTKRVLIGSLAAVFCGAVSNGGHAFGDSQVQDTISASAPLLETDYDDPPPAYSDVVE